MPIGTSPLEQIMSPTVIVTLWLTLWAGIAALTFSTVMGWYL
jgi:hypothetical protein